MEDLVTFCVVLLHLFVCTCSQRIAPGVPPQQYQHQQPPQQYQQVPQQQHYPSQPPVPPQPPLPQQIPVHQQQPTYQQVPVQPQVHAGQLQHPHGHAQPQQLLNSANIALEKEHIQEHLEVPIDTSKMSEQELQFHYFKMHDADNNNKLDGCELIKSLIHWHENEEGEKHEVKVQKDSDLEAMIDPILKEMDTNNDGFVDYAEFKKAS